MNAQQYHTHGNFQGMKLYNRYHHPHNGSPARLFVKIVIFILLQNFRTLKVSQCTVLNMYNANAVLTHYR